MKTDDPKEALDIFVSNIGHHISQFIAAESVASSKTRSTRSVNLSDPDKSMNTSNWQPSKESSILEEMFQPSHPYISRKVGVTPCVQ